MYRVLMRVGEECVNYARVNGGYLDQTGNLRSSIGYVVMDNGKIISQSGFKKVKEGTFGATSGREFLQEILSKHGKWNLFNSGCWNELRGSCGSIELRCYFRIRVKG